jgi:hypothetical protein
MRRSILTLSLTLTLTSTLTPTPTLTTTASSHHQETWDPNWNLRTLVMALRGHILTQPREIGGILTTAETQQKLAILSRDWSCPICGIEHSKLVSGSVSLDLPIDQVRGDKGFDRGLVIDIGSDGKIDTEKILSLVGHKKSMKELNLATKKLKKMKYAKMIKEKNQLKLFRRIFFSLFVGFAVFVFQFWSSLANKGTGAGAGGSLDSKLVW